MKGKVETWITRCWCLVCRLKYAVIKERVLFLEAFIVDDEEGRICIGGGFGG